MRYTHILSVSIFLLAALSCAAQVQMFQRLDVPFIVNGQTLKNPLAGGLNTPQYSAADLNNDGIQDMVIFDRAGDIVMTYLNSGVVGLSSYTPAPDYACNFPKLNDYALLRDFNKDGAADIFCASPGNGQEVQVFEGFFENNILHFKQFFFKYDGCSTCNTKYIFYPANQPGYWNNMLIATSDLPDVNDVDNDGDLDILTFDAAVGGHVWYFENRSVENGFGTDSLQYILKDRCWGRFYESGLAECKNDLSTNPDTCSNGFASPGGVDDRDGLHPGSTVTSYDQDNDGDKELVLGDISFNCLNMMTNGGSTESAWMIAQDTAFPSYNTSVDISTFPAAFFIDINNDGKKDMIASPNNKSIGEDQRCVWYYENMSTSGHNFELQTQKLFVGDMVDLGTTSHPAFADVNADGLKDIVVGTYGFFSPGISTNARLYLFMNTGTSTQPQYTLNSSNWLNMADYAPNDYDFAPTFGDLDSDGDDDLLIGSNGGGLYCFKNQGGENNPMVMVQDFNPMWISMDVGIASVPALYDLSGDGVIDIILGERNGNINYFKNTGTPFDPLFANAPTVQRLGGINLQTTGQAVGFSTPTITFTTEGLTLVSGAQAGHYEMYTNLSPSGDTLMVFNGSFGNIDDGERSHAAFGDIDSDGILDMVTGNYRGGLTIYKTELVDCSVSTKEEMPQNITPLVNVHPNPTSDWVRVSWPVSDPVRWVLFNALGQQIATAMVPMAPFQIQMTDLPTGIYTLELTSGKHRAVKKVVFKG